VSVGLFCFKSSHYIAHSTSPYPKQGVPPSFRRNAHPRSLRTDDASEDHEMNVDVIADSRTSCGVIIAMCFIYVSFFFGKEIDDRSVVQAAVPSNDAENNHGDFFKTGSSYCHVLTCIERSPFPRRSPALSGTCLATQSWTYGNQVPTVRSPALVGRKSLSFLYKAGHESTRGSPGSVPASILVSKINTRIRTSLFPRVTRIRGSKLTSTCGYL